jgi:protoporphyrinogen oxidase
MGRTVVVGAGVAGLTIAYQLARQGHDVTVVERNDVVGGLARTWHYGDFHFDVGPHRFHTDNKKVEGFIRGVLGAEVIEIPRKSGVRMFGRFHDWPLRPGILFAMPVSAMFQGARDLIFKEHLTGESFEADVVNKYGRTLYDIFFGPYTEKFLFYSPTDLHRDWGRAGVNRAVIDKRASSDTLWSLLRNTLMPKPVETTFLFLPHGVGRFSEMLAEGIRAAGGEGLVGQDVTGLDVAGDRVTGVRTARQTFNADDVIWTGPLDVLNRFLGIEGIHLEYLSTLFYNFEISKPAKLDYQWTYYGSDEVFPRLSTPTAFAPTMAPAGKSGLCVELTCREGDERWQNPQRYLEPIASDLVRTQTIDVAGDITGVHIERMSNTYPVYKLDYLQQLSANLKALGRFSNLLPAGRCGRFWYNNMDHSIGQGLTMADKILRGDALSGIDSGDREFWENTDEADAS